MTTDVQITTLNADRTVPSSPQQFQFTTQMQNTHATTAVTCKTHVHTNIYIYILYATLPVKLRRRFEIIDDVFVITTTSTVNDYQHSRHVLSGRVRNFRIQQIQPNGRRVHGSGIARIAGIVVPVSVRQTRRSVRLTHRERYKHRRLISTRNASKC